MSQSFLALGVSAPVVRALEARNIHHPFAVQELVLPDALARPRHPRRGADRLRQDARIRPAARRAHRGQRRTAGRTRARPDPRARDPGRRRSATARGDQGPARRDRLRRRVRRAAGEEGARRARARRDTRPPQRPARAAPHRARRRPHARPRRGRPHARHGLQAAGRPHPAHACPTQPPDDALLRHARRRGRRARTRVHVERVALPRGAAERPPAGNDRAHLRRR